MNAEIISVGTEIVLGNIQNTHAKYLSQELADLGINVYYQTAVGDNDARFQDILKQAVERSDLIFLTGGLGPTTDDITKETACRLLDIPCVEDEHTKKRIASFFERSGRKMTENNLKQAMVPEGGKILDNKWGTAPGFIIEKNNTILVLLPGPPRELIPMFEEQVKPYLRELSDDTIFSKNVHVFGIGESALEEKIQQLVTSENPTVALYAKTGEVQIRVTAKAPGIKEAKQRVDEMIEKLYGVLGNLIYGIDAGSLHEALVKRLSETGHTVATAESCTGGLIAEKITSVPGSSAVFGLGVVSYANRIKELELGVRHETLEQYGAVSAETAVEMAKGLAEKSGADFNIAVTGIAGPSGGTPEKPVGTVCIAVENRGKVRCRSFHFSRRQNERDYVRALSSLYALDMVRLSLDHYGIEDDDSVCG